MKVLNKMWTPPTKHLYIYVYMYLFLIFEFYIEKIIYGQPPCDLSSWGRSHHIKKVHDEYDHMFENIANTGTFQ